MAAAPRARLGTLNVVGCGNVGRALARCWTATGVFRVGGVVNRSLASAERAVAFIGEGRALASTAELAPADVVLVGAGDDHIEAASTALCDAPLERTAVVFHASGALASSALHALRRPGLSLGSAHPAKSFADAASAARTFAGTHCGIEGDTEARALLREAFEAIGGRCFEIPAEKKTLYHAALVFVSNYVTSLLEVGLQVQDEVGIPRDVAQALIAPLAEECVRNAVARGPAAALTGPIARGDRGVVRDEIAALDAWSPAHAELYRALGRVAIALSRAKGKAAPEALRQLEELCRS